MRRKAHQATPRRAEGDPPPAQLSQKDRPRRENGREDPPGAVRDRRKLAQIVLMWML